LFKNLKPFGQPREETVMKKKRVLSFRSLSFISNHPLSVFNYPLGRFAAFAAVFSLVFAFGACDTGTSPGSSESETVAAPTANPPEGDYTGTQSVTLRSATEGASIYYTVNGASPGKESTLYSGPVSITETTTLKAIAVKSGMNDSAVLTAAYTIMSEGLLTSLADVWIAHDEVNAEDESPPFLVFASDYTVSMANIPGTYSVSAGNTLNLIIEGQSCSGNFSIANSILTLTNFSSDLSITVDGDSFLASVFNGSFSRGGKFNLTGTLPVITGSGGRFTVWVRDAPAGEEWSGAALDLAGFGTWVSEGHGYYDVAAAITAATPGQPSEYGRGNFAPLKWYGNSRTGAYDVFIVTDTAGASSFSGYYKNNVPFTGGACTVTMDGWNGWTYAAVTAGGL
jgi:hypothetical protein